MCVRTVGGTGLIAKLRLVINLVKAPLTQCVTAVLEIKDEKMFSDSGIFIFGFT